MCRCAMMVEELSPGVKSRLMGSDSVKLSRWKERNADGYFGTSTTMTITDASHSRQIPILLQIALGKCLSPSGILY